MAKLSRAEEEVIIGVTGRQYVPLIRTQEKLPPLQGGYDVFVDQMWLGADALSARNMRDLFICTSGLGGETGEVLEKLKKYVRDGVLDVEALELELGDVLYYLTVISHMFGSSLTQVMSANTKKLTARREAGTLQGSGDKR